MSLLIYRKTKQERKSFYVKVINRKIQQYIKNGCKGDLNLICSPITKLPDNLTKVGGDLDLYRTKIIKLPENLTVNCHLDICYTNIKELPENLTVNGSLDIGFTEIEVLPQSLIIKDDLFCEFTPLSRKYNEKQIKKLHPNIKGNVYT